ncbi:hypothetical protein ACQRBP_04710 [Eubacteriales bacterium SGI.150]
MSPLFRRLRVRGLRLQLCHGQPPRGLRGTWADLWHNRDPVDAMLTTGRSEAPREKIRYLTDVLIRQYGAATRENLPWTYMLG